ncbi:MAG: 50S ribosomal protein L3 [Bacteroidota bacterium]
MKIKKAENGCYFIKKGMTSVIGDKGVLLPVTVLERMKNAILGQKNDRSLCVFSGYYGRFNKPEIGTLSKYTEDFPKKGFLKEIKLSDPKSEIALDLFTEGAFVDVSAITKGHGFQGGVKRYGFKGGRASHGCSLAHRTIGSTGCRHLPSKTIKGRRMPGHMGCVLRTQQNLKVFRLENNYDALLVVGSVPGPKHGLVFVKKAVKKCDVK